MNVYMIGPYPSAGCRVSIDFSSIRYSVPRTKKTATITYDSFFLVKNVDRALICSGLYVPHYPAVFAHTGFAYCIVEQKDQTITANASESFICLALLLPCYGKKLHRFSEKAKGAGLTRGAVPHPAL